MKKAFVLAVLISGAALVALPALLTAGQAPAAPAAGAPGLRYEIWVELDPAGKMLTGKEEIVWTNPTKDTVPDMLLHLYWNAFKNEASAFMREAAAETMFGGGAAPEDGEWGWIDVTDIRLADGTDLKPGVQFVTPDGPDHPDDQTVARVLFPVPVQPGESVRLRIEFRSKVPRTVARSGYYKNSYFIAQWFPKPGVYEEGQGWNCHAYHQNSEFFADFADFTVHITVPRGLRRRVFRQGRRHPDRRVGRHGHDHLPPGHGPRLRLDDRPPLPQDRAGFRRRPGSDRARISGDGGPPRPARSTRSGCPTSR